MGRKGWKAEFLVKMLRFFRYDYPQEWATRYYNYVFSHVPDSDGFMRNATQFTKKIGGAESNVAIGLARLGHHAGWISKLGDDEFGKVIFAFLKGETVDVSKVAFDQEAPTGIYFKEPRRQNNMRVY